MKLRLLAIAVGGLVLSCGAGGAGSDARTPAEPPASKTRAGAAPMASEEREQFERCQSTLDGRCRAAHPSGGADEEDCREKLWERYARIKTPAARREYLASLGCRVR